MSFNLLALLNAFILTLKAIKIFNARSDIGKSL